MRSLRLVRALVLLVASSALISNSIGSGAAAGVSKEAAPAAPTLPKGIAVAPNSLIALQQARASERPVIVKDETTKTTLVYANPDQTFTSTIADGPVQEPDPSSPIGFAPIDLGLKQGMDGWWKPKVGDADVEFSNGGIATPVSMNVGKQQLSMQWPSKLPAPTISGSVATYKDVSPGVDLQVQALTSGFDLRIVLTQRPSSATTYRLPLALEGLTPSVTNTGRLQFQNNGSTEVTADQPVMYDAAVDDAGNPAHLAAVPTSVDAASGGAVVVSPQADFLSDPSTKYPVTIDPAPNLAATIDTFVNSASPTQTYAGSTLIKAGKSSAEGPDRALLQFNTGSLVGANISAASLNLYESFSNSCTATGLEVWDAASSWGSSVNWNTQPAKTAKWASASTSAGGGTGCPSAYVSLATGGGGSNTMQGLVQAWANQTRTNNGVMVVASNETSTSYFKRFSSNEDGSNAPYLAVTYNFPPTVTNRLPNNAGWVTSTTPTLSGTFNDSDTGTVGQIQYELDTNGGTVIDTQTGNSVPAGSTSSWQVPGADSLTNGTTYKWRARGYDGTDYGNWTGYRTFTVDTTNPGAPTITSSTHPNPAQWYLGMSFTGSWSAVTDTTSGVAGYAVKVDQISATVPSGVLQTALTYSKTVAYTGTYYLHVRAQDNAGNWGSTTTFQFNAGAGGLLSPNPGDRSQRYATVQVAAGSGLTGATLQYRRSPFDNWTNIPAADVVDSDNGNASITWPVTISGGTTHHLRWDAKSTLGSVDGPVMVRSTFSPGSPSPTTGITISLDQNFFDGNSSQGNAFASVGPGQVNLVTGDFIVSGSDANVGDFSVDRSFDSTAANAAGGGVFGPGWSSSLNLGVYQRLHSGADSSQGTFVVVYGADDTEYGFQENQAGTGYVQTPDASGMTLTNPSGTFVLTDESGVQTTFTKPSGSADYYPSKVITPNNGSGSSATTSMSFAATAGVTRPVQEVAPPPAGVDCSTSPLTTRGCQTLSFTYATANTSSNTCSTSYGDYAGRLKTVSYTAWDPATSQMTTVAAAGYSYDTGGMLRATCDPRISPVLATTYAYDASGHLSTITPPGLDAWTFSYDAQDRITSASRANDPTGTQTTSVAYAVPISGSGAPYNLSAGTAGTWGQQDAPTQATAVFPPDEVPSGNPPADYNFATIYYMDDNGNEVNVASPGGGITTTEYDLTGNVVRDLTAQNRADALSSGDTVSYALSHDTQYIYDPTGAQLLRRLEPEHNVVRPDGTTAAARRDTQYTYDQTVPVVTSETEGALVDGSSADVDVRTTMYDYSGQSNLGFTLLQPTSVTVDPGAGHLGLTTTTRYDNLGRAIATMAPANPAGGDAHETDTVFYRAATGSGVAACDSHPEWDGLPCQVAPAAQPGTAGYPDLVTTTYTYDMWGQVVTRTDTAGSSFRTTTNSYDAGERIIHQSVVGPGTALPTVDSAYSATSGLPTTTSTTSAGTTITVIRTYDQDGRTHTYTDADGNVSTYSYDVSNRVVTLADGKGTQTMSYNQGSERRGLLTAVNDSQAGTVSATYDADGQESSETLPNGLAASITRDSEGYRTALTYVKTTNCVSNCTWYTDQIMPSVHEQWITRTSSLSSQQYTYDAVGRLTWVYDTLNNLCSTRQYVYDSDSNRTQITSRTPNGDGSCNTTSTGSQITSTYDAGDRITTAGYSFDAMGRITSVPASDNGGNALSATYYVNDTVNTVTSAGTTETVTLDPDARTRSVSTGVVKTYHYSCDGDAPTWIAENGTGSAWTRNIVGPSGLVGVADQTGSVMLEISDLHGDVVGDVNDSGTVTSLSDVFEATEFGQPRASQLAPRYDWLGTYERTTDASGLVFMGARLYSPVTGRFLQPDSVPRGSANSYDYADQDPINETDISGNESSLRGCAVDKTGTYRVCLTMHFYIHKFMYAGAMKTFVKLDRWTVNWKNVNPCGCGRRVSSGHVKVDVLGFRKGHDGYVNSADINFVSPALDAPWDIYPPWAGYWITINTHYNHQCGWASENISGRSST